MNLPPLKYVEEHEITITLKSQGVTDEQRDALRFSSSNRDSPFDLWSFRWQEGTPQGAMPLFKPYCALKWLILEDPPYSRNKEDAWRLINDWVAAKNAQLGLSTRAAQRARAQKPRGHFAESGMNITQLIKELALRPEHHDKQAKELWPHLHATLDELGSDPEEIPHPSDLRKAAYKYFLQEGTPRQITYGRFANIVSLCRKKKSH